MEKVFASWSGGKDSCWACYQAARSGLDVCCLVNMANEDGSRSWIHAIRPELMALQAKALGIPLFRGRSSMAAYEKGFRDALALMRSRGMTGGVFGDIDLEENRQWVSRQCHAAGVRPHFPLWGQPQEAILREFIEAGFEAIVVVAEAERLGEQWLGRRVDMRFLSGLSGLKESRGVQPAGEAGEYHTFVIDGPSFRQRVEVLQGQRVLRGGYWFLDIARAALRAR
jgi:uncharacterized protein (TIGR00290 family)